MSEKPIQQQVSEVAGASYERYDSLLGQVEAARRTTESAKHIATLLHNKFNEPGYISNSERADERVVAESISNIDSASAYEAEQVAKTNEFNGGVSSYVAENAATFHDLASEMAAKDGVQINVQQSQETAQPVDAR